MTRPENRLHVEYQAWAGREPYLFRLITFRAGGSSAVATAVTMAPCTDGDDVEPFLRLDAKAVQQLMDDLWHAGVRPTNVKHSDERVDAMEKHLQDMRRLAFESIADVRRLTPVELRRET